MPRKEIQWPLTSEIEIWIHFKHGKIISGFWIDHGDPRNEKETWTYFVDGEPLIIIHRQHTKYVQPRSYGGEGVHYGPPETVVYCSEKHARELEELGIVKFSETPEEIK